VNFAIKREQSQACFSYAEQKAKSTKSIAIKREQSQACLSYAEQKQNRRSQ
jgi:uncharacterized protein (DUF433 family)